MSSDLSVQFSLDSLTVRVECTEDALYELQTEHEDLSERLEASLDFEKNKLSTLKGRVSRLETSDTSLLETISAQSTLISTLQSNLAQQQQQFSLALQRIEKLEQSLLASQRDYSNVKQLSVLLPIISHLQTLGISEQKRVEEEISRHIVEQRKRDHDKEQRRLNEEMHQLFTTNPILFISRYPQNFFQKFGSCIKFISKTKGSNLSVYQNCMNVVKKDVDSFSQSFVAINHPPMGSIRLALTQLPFGFDCYSCIGYFDPSKCQSKHAVYNFTGVDFEESNLHFRIQGDRVNSYNICFEVNDYLDVQFKESQIVYKCGNWSRAINKSPGWVFGMWLGQEEGWEIV
ncbi:hypothetical protein RCL1_009042 [Eukaryota sp. TZLM3-RCL]